jgi:hypothetical protein
MVINSLGQFVPSQFGHPMDSGAPPDTAVLAIYHWLLWMRVYELRKSTILSHARSNIQEAEQVMDVNRP